jgi:hypothetical protein
MPSKQQDRRWRRWMDMTVTARGAAAVMGTETRWLPSSLPSAATGRPGRAGGGRRPDAVAHR